MRWGFTHAGERCLLLPTGMMIYTQNAPFPGSFFCFKINSTKWQQENEKFPGYVCNLLLCSHHPNPYAKLSCITIALQHKLIELCVLREKPGSKQCSSPPFCVWRSQQNAVCASDILCTAMRSLDCLPSPIIGAAYGVFLARIHTHISSLLIFMAKLCVFQVHTPPEVLSKSTLRWGYRSTWAHDRWYDFWQSRYNCKLKYIIVSGKMLIRYLWFL